MKAVLDVVFIVLDLFVWLLIIQAVLSWLLAFNVLNARNQVVGMIWRFTTALTEPLLKPIRRVVKPMNGMDFSPLILLLLVYLVQRLLAYYVYPNVF
jgi:YggT family protein